MIRITTLLTWLKKGPKTSPNGTLDKGAATKSAHHDSTLEVTPTRIRTWSQAMPKFKEKGHLYEQIILVQYVVSMGTILTIIMKSVSLKRYRVTEDKEDLPSKLR